MNQTLFSVRAFWLSAERSSYPGSYTRPDSGAPNRHYSGHGASTQRTPAHHQGSRSDSDTSVRFSFSSPRTSDSAPSVAPCAYFGLFALATPILGAIAGNLLFTYFFAIRNSSRFSFRSRFSPRWVWNQLLNCKPSMTRRPSLPKWSPPLDLVLVLCGAALLRKLRAFSRPREDWQTVSAESREGKLRTAPASSPSPPDLSSSSISSNHTPPIHVRSRLETPPAGIVLAVSPTNPQRTTRPSEASRSRGWRPRKANLQRPSANASLYTSRR